MGVEIRKQATSETDDDDEEEIERPSNLVKEGKGVNNAVDNSLASNMKETDTWNEEEAEKTAEEAEKNAVETEILESKTVEVHCKVMRINDHEVEVNVTESAQIQIRLGHVGGLNCGGAYYWNSWHIIIGTCC